MKTIEDIYEPYNFSATRCYIFVIEVKKDGFIKIEHKLPSYVKELKGIFVSTTNATIQGNVTGLISMNFNGQAFKSYQAVVYKTAELGDCSHPETFNDTLLPNSFIQGYYYGLAPTVSTKASPKGYTLTIYIHYENPEYKKS